MSNTNTTVKDHILSTLLSLKTSIDSLNKRVTALENDSNSNWLNESATTSLSTSAKPSPKTAYVQKKLYRNKRSSPLSEEEKLSIMDLYHKMRTSLGNTVTTYSLSNNIHSALKLQGSSCRTYDYLIKEGAPKDGKGPFGGIYKK